MPNTTDSALTTDHRIREMATTILQNRLAPLGAFSRQFTLDELKPKATVQVEVVTAGGTPQTNATNFEDSDNFVATSAAVPVTVNQITHGGHLTNSERQGGFALENWVDITVGAFADKIIDTVFTLITEVNFTGAPIVSAAASFGRNEIKQLWAAVVKGSQKSLILDGDHFAQLLPADLQDFDVLNVGLPGWNRVALNTRWTAAGTNIAGFACDPSAIALAAGLPAVDSNSVTVASIGEIIIPGPNLVVRTFRWYSNSSRTSWFTFDVMLGAAVVNANALRLLKSA